MDTVSSEYLMPLLEGTPLAMERLKVAWNDLTQEQKAYLLDHGLRDVDSNPLRINWHHHRLQLLELATADQTLYIRYLAAKYISKPFAFKEEEKDSLEYLRREKLYKQVSADPSDLIRNAHEESERFYYSSGVLGNPSAFWKLSQLARLAIVNGIEENGEEIAELLKYVTDPSNECGIEDHNILDVLIQYVGVVPITERVNRAQKFADLNRDGWADYSSRKSLEALWDAVRYLPSYLRVVLLEALPVIDGAAIANIVKSLDDPEILSFMYRDEVKLKEMRREFYLQTEKESLRCAAMSSKHFELYDSDISELVILSNDSEEAGKRKLKDLVLLAQSCGGATLAQMEAICNLINKAPSNLSGMFGHGDALGAGEQIQERRIKTLTAHQLNSEIFNLRLYEHCKYISKDDSCEEIEALIAEDNPWQTYLNIKEAVPPQKWVETFGYLPSVFIGNKDYPALDDSVNSREDDSQ